MRVLLLIVLLAAGGCATLAAERAPVCDGRHRRPANPHGSVLAAEHPAASAPIASAPSCP